jgi:hypothetical protein
VVSGVKRSGLEAGHLSRLVQRLMGDAVPLLPPLNLNGGVCLNAPGGGGICYTFYSDAVTGVSTKVVFLIGCIV